MTEIVSTFVVPLWPNRCGIETFSQENVKRLFRAEMTRRGMTYEKLSERLAAIGINDTAVNLRNKVARGRFSATFLVQCLPALCVRAMRLSEAIDGQLFSV